MDGNDENLNNFIKNTNDGIRYLMDFMNQSYSDILSMPFKFFEDTIKWKVELEKKKAEEAEQYIEQKH